MSVVLNGAGFCDDQVPVLSTIGRGPIGPRGAQGPKGDTGFAEYAVPIEWNIDTNYHQNTIVLHEGNSYISLVDVPDGIDISNDSYWMMIGENNAQVEELRQQMLMKACVFDTVADMKASDLLYVGAICHTSGFHSAGDGGAAWYKVTDTAIANEMDVIALQNDLYATFVIVESYVTPEMFGAYGDDIHNDSDAIQKSLSFNCSCIMDGTYLVTTSINIPSGTRIDGSGTIKRGAQIATVLNADLESDVIIRGLHIDGNAIDFPNDGSYFIYRDALVRFTRCNNIEISNCLVHNFPQHISGIIFYCDNSSLHDCEVYQNNGARNSCGIILGHTQEYTSDDTSGGSFNCKIYNCYVHDISTDITESAVPSESGYGIYLLSGKENKIYGNKIENVNWVSILSQGEYTLSGGVGHEIYGNTIIQDSKSICPRTDYLGDVGYYQEGSTEIHIHDNYFYHGKTNSNRPLIVYIDYDPKTIFENNVVDGDLSDGNLKNIGYNNGVLFRGNTYHISPLNGIASIIYPYANPTVLKYENEKMSVTGTSYPIGRGGTTPFPIDGSITVKNCDLVCSSLISETTSDILDINIDDCVITGNDKSIDKLLIAGNNSNIIIKDNILKNFYRGLLKNAANTTSDSIYIVNNIFSDMGKVMNVGGAASIGELVIRDNTVDVSGTLCNIASSTALPKITIEENTIITNTDMPIYLETSGLISLLSISKNTIIGTSEYGIYSYYNLGSTTYLTRGAIVGNVIIGKTTPIRGASEAGGLVMRYNSNQ